MTFGGKSLRLRDYPSPVKEKVHSHVTMTVWEQHPWSHHKGSTCMVRTGDQLYPVLCCHCHCQLGQDIPTVSIHHSRLKALRSPRCHVVLLSVTAYWPDPNQLPVQKILIWRCHTTLAIDYANIKFQQLAPGLKKLFVQAGFLSDPAIFKLKRS